MLKEKSCEQPTKVCSGCVNNAVSQTASNSRSSKRQGPCYRQLKVQVSTLTVLTISDAVNTFLAPTT